MIPIVNLPPDILEAIQPAIPHSTLANIAKTGIVPKKWRHRFPGVGAVDDRPRISIHWENMESAAATIVKHIKPHSKIEVLITLLQNELSEQQRET